MSASAAEAKSAAKRRRVLRRNRSAIGDLVSSLRLYELWLALAKENVTQRYRRAALGVGWIAISFLLMVAIFVLVFGRSSPARTEFEYTLYLATGLMAFTFVSTMVTGGCAIFGSNGGWIKSSRAPLGVLVFSTIASSYFEMFILAFIVLPLVVIHSIPNPEHLLVFGAAILIFGINAIWCCLLLGSIGAWSADFQQFVPAVMRIAFFATPIFWDYEVTEGRRLLLAQYNPFTHFVELFRRPLMSEMPSETNWIVVGSITLGGWVVALIVFSHAKRKLAAWV